MICDILFRYHYTNSNDLIRHPFFSHPKLNGAHEVTGIYIYIFFFNNQKGGKKCKKKGGEVGNARRGRLDSVKCI